MADSTGMADLRAEHVDPVVTGFALQLFKLKQVCLISPSSSWKETYFKETKTDLSGGTGSAVKGIPRLANFPYGEVTWTEASTRNQKHGMDSYISWEDAVTNDIDVISRTLLRNARAVAKSVDDHIWDVLSETQAFTNANTVTIAAGHEWDSSDESQRDPIQDILNAIKEIEVDNYDTSNAYLLLSPKDYANLLGNANVRNAGQFYTADVTKNGKVGKLLGLTIIKSNTITADYAAVVVKNDCTYKQAHALSTHTEYTPGQHYKIRSWEVGTCQQRQPEAICGIVNTQA